MGFGCWVWSLGFGFRVRVKASRFNLTVALRSLESKADERSTPPGQFRAALLCESVSEGAIVFQCERESVCVRERVCVKESVKLNEPERERKKDTVIECACVR